MWSSFLILDKSTHWLLFLAYCGCASLISCHSTTVELLAFLSTSCAVIPCTRGLLTSFRLC